jgi:PiT family inorganic phosphate transporter
VEDTAHGWAFPYANEIQAIPSTPVPNSPDFHTRLLPGIGLLALVLMLTLTLVFGNSGSIDKLPLLLAATAAVLYLAINIGANDAANHVGILVGAGAISLGGALLIAAGGELAGSLLASDMVNARLRDDLLDNDALTGAGHLSAVLVAGMVAAGLWLHAATLARMPISATHTIVGGLVGAGIGSGGWQVVQWEQIRQIASVWVLSPVAAAVAAALALILVERILTYRSNAIGAARIRVPLLVSLLTLLMSGVYFSEFSPRHWEVSQQPLVAALAVAVMAFLLVQPQIYRASQNLKSNRRGLNRLFNAPLLLAAFFFAFAHGANDVANVAAPMAALLQTVAQGSTPAHFTIPLGVLLLGSAGIALGIVAYGHRVIRTVGKGITDLDRLRAFSIGLSALAIIALATRFGYPVSTTHILVGAILGVGLMREVQQRREQSILARVRGCFSADQSEDMERFVHRFDGATRARRAEMLARLFSECRPRTLSSRELAEIQSSHRSMIRPRLVGAIVIFWLLTLPAAGLLGAGMVALIGWMT